MPPSRVSAGRARGGVVLVLALAIDSTGNGLFLPLSLIYFTRLTPVDLPVVGLLISIATAIAIPVPAITGSLADRWGGLPLIVLAQGLQAAGYLACVGVSGPAGILVASTLIAVGVRIFWSSVFTAMAEYAQTSAPSDPRARTQDSWFAVANGARTAGLAVGGLITGVVIADGRAGAYRVLAGCTAACFVVAAVVLVLFVRTGGPHAAPPSHGPGRYVALLRDRSFLLLTAVNTVHATAVITFALSLPTVVLVGLRGPAWLTSVILAGNAVVITALSVPVVGRLAGRRRTALLMGSAAVWTIGCAVLAVAGILTAAPAIVLLVVGALLFTAAELVQAPVSTAMAAALAPEGSRGRYLASFQYSFAIATLVSPAYFATLWNVGHALPFVGLGVVCAASIAGLLAIQRRVPDDLLRG